MSLFRDREGWASITIALIGRDPKSNIIGYNLVKRVADNSKKFQIKVKDNIDLR
jgi:hypothetical protein